MNHTKEKILLLLLLGFRLGSTYDPGRQWRIVKTAAKKWKKLDSQKLRKDINYLYYVKIISKVKNDNGSVDIILTEKGEFRALNIKLRNIRNKNLPWDGKWRMVAFDMPEKLKGGRDSLRHKLKEIGFCELQKSVFICPYDCIGEISLLVNFFNLKEYVRLGVLEFIDNEDYFKKFFKIG